MPTRSTGGGTANHTDLEYFDHVGGERHQRRGDHPAVHAVHEYAGPDGVRHRLELGLVVALAPRARHLPGERGRQPIADFLRHRVRLHFRQLVVLLGRQSPARNTQVTTGGSTPRRIPDSRVCRGRCRIARRSPSRRGLGRYGWLTRPEHNNSIPTGITCSDCRQRNQGSWIKPEYLSYRFYTTLLYTDRMFTSDK